MKITEQELIDFIQDEFESSGRRLQDIVKISDQNCVASGMEIGYREALMKIKYAIYDGFLE